MQYEIHIDIHTMTGTLTYLHSYEPTRTNTSFSDDKYIIYIICTVHEVMYVSY